MTTLSHQSTRNEFHTELERLFRLDAQTISVAQMLRSFEALANLDQEIRKFTLIKTLYALIHRCTNKCEPHQSNNVSTYASRLKCESDISLNSVERSK
ncbi:MAG: hypothetical protein HGA19_09235 [Oscillochloris sp.]|nr:hypothetical protein [Oscillochloris sp.]